MPRKPRGGRGCGFSNPRAPARARARAPGQRELQPRSRHPGGTHGLRQEPEEIARIEHALSHPRFVNGADALGRLPHRPSVIARSPAAAAGAGRRRRASRAMVGRWQSNCVGDFFGGAIYVAARHDGIDGEYVLAMYMDSDMPTIYGRDLFGEPKKIATSNADPARRRLPRLRRPRRRAAHRAAGDVTKDLGAFDAEGYNFNFKARPAADGIGLRGGRDPHAGQLRRPRRRLARGRRLGRPARHRARPARRAPDPLRARRALRGVRPDRQLRGGRDDPGRRVPAVPLRAPRRLERARHRGRASWPPRSDAPTRPAARRAGPPSRGSDAGPGRGRGLAPGSAGRDRRRPTGTSPRSRRAARGPPRRSAPCATRPRLHHVARSAYCSALRACCSTMQHAGARARRPRGAPPRAGGRRRAARGRATARRRAAPAACGRAPGRA